MRTAKSPSVASGLALCSNSEVFGEAEYQRWLKARGTIEIVEDKADYHSARQKFPSID
jgi:hypothetical protein